MIPMLTLGGNNKNHYRAGYNNCYKELVNTAYKNIFNYLNDNKHNTKEIPSLSESDKANTIKIISKLFDKTEEEIKSIIDNKE